MLRFVREVFFAILLSSDLILPDFIYSFIYKGFYQFSNKSLKEFLGIFVISLLILSVKSNLFKKFLIILFSTFSLIEMLHFQYFHGLLLHYEILFFFTQFSELTESLSGVLSYMYLPFAVWIVQLLFGFAILKKAQKSVYKIKYLSFIIILLLIIGPVSANKRHNISSMMANNRSFSMINMYNTISLFAGREVVGYLFNHKKAKKFKSYVITKESRFKPPQNIIFIMGESLNYNLMHLFGFGFEDTPILDALKKEPAFIYKKAFSSGVDTMTAVPTFFLLKREPENIKLLGENRTNLLTLAKEAGYKVYYVTTQKLNIMASYSGSADVVKRYKGFDEKMLDIFNKIDFSKKNFIIIHQRNSHSPYENSTPKRFFKFNVKDLDYKDYMINSYANSVLYTDYLIGKVASLIKNHKNSLLLMTPDHGEAFASKEAGGRYGHAFLNKAVARVPILFYSNDIDTKIVDSFKKLECYNHYNLGKFTANILGYKVVNPNEDGRYFIQGTMIDGSNGFIGYSNQECKNLN